MSLRDELSYDPRLQEARTEQQRQKDIDDLRKVIINGEASEREASELMESPVFCRRVLSALMEHRQLESPSPTEAAIELGRIYGLIAEITRPLQALTIQAQRRAELRRLTNGRLENEGA